MPFHDVINDVNDVIRDIYILIIRTLTNIMYAGNTVMMWVMFVIMLIVFEATADSHQKHDDTVNETFNAATSENILPKNVSFGRYVRSVESRNMKAYWAIIRKEMGLNDTRELSQTGRPSTYIETMFLHLKHMKDFYRRRLHAISTFLAVHKYFEVDRRFDADYDFDTDEARPKVGNIDIVR